MKRIPRHYPIWDQCNISIEILNSRVEEYFQKNFPDFKNRFYCDFGKEIDKTFPHKETLDIITFGDVIRKTFQWGNLIHQDLRFWSISSPFQKLQNEFFYGAQVSHLIARDDLFKRLSSTAPKLDQGLDLIYAGRLSRQKNIKALISFAHALNKSGIECRLHIFGSYDERYHEELGRWKLSSYEEELKEFLNGFLKEKGDNWSPKFYGQVDKEDWPKRDFKNPVGISLSTFIGEDLGVSLAQAQESGWPIICSDFGGHQDIAGEHIFKIPSWLCAPFAYADSVIYSLAERAAKTFLESGLKSYSKISSTKDINTTPLATIDNSRRKLCSELGSSVFWLGDEGLEEFSVTHKGGLFLKKCRAFLETPADQEVVIITKEFGAHSLNSEDQQFFESTLKEIKPDQKIRLICADDLAYKDHILALKEASRALCLPSVEEKHKKFISQLFS